MAVGASTWASGSQVCSGTMGTLMAKAMNSSTQTTFTKAKPRMGASPPKSLAWASFSRSKVCRAGVPSAREVGCEAWYSAMIASSISTEPASV